MPLIKLNSSLEYHLVNFDENGIERLEPDGRRQSETIIRLLRDPSAAYTHVLFMSHGWKGDLPAARAQYDAWVEIAAAARSDAGAGAAKPFNPLVIGLHWPSLPWGNETDMEPEGHVLGADNAEVEVWAQRLASTAAARSAISRILAGTTHDIATGPLPPDLKAAYMTIASEAGLATGADDGAPGHDHPPFDPNAIIADAKRLGLLTNSDPAALVLGGSSWSMATIRDALLMPLRQLSFWKMKDRARQFGERGARDLLTTIQALGKPLDIHLMGHSFGCIVVSAAVAGAPHDKSLRIPVGSLFLVQGALSLWSYADKIPSRSGSGYFRRIVTEKLVRGPIVATLSSEDTAVGTIYPLGAWVAGGYVLGTALPLYGGVGTFGLQGASAVDLPMGSLDHTYPFKGGAIYNLDASTIIRNGDGLSGAHSDIVHPEVAHVLWEAIRATPDVVTTSKPYSGGLLGLGPRGRVVADAASPSAGSWMLDELPDVVGAPPPVAPADDIPPRWVNAGLDSRRANEPLVISRWYTLKLSIDVAPTMMPGGVAAPLADLRFEEGRDSADITVQINSADFETAPAMRTLTLPRRGPSTEPVRFGISPLHDGPCVIQAILHLDGNFLQQLTLTFQVGKEATPEIEIETAGRAISAVGHLRRRDIGVSLKPLGSGFDCTTWGSTSRQATLPFNQAFVANAVDRFRAELTKVVYHNESGEPVFQTRIDIPTAANDFALKTLARAGALLFNNIFYGPEAGPDSHAIGDFLARKLRADGEPLTLQVVSRGTPIPWTCLYIGDASADATLSWDNFVGMRHIVEQIPTQSPGADDPDSKMPSDKPKLGIGLNMNAGIDAAMKRSFVGDQMTYWKAAASKRRISVNHRSTKAEFLAALNDPTTNEQIIYFYCHAEAGRPDRPGGLDAAKLILESEKFPIMLEDLKLDAPVKRILPSGPLVFINACESADLSPAFYDGFVPYFMSKGARGVIGTECVTPALFAQHWATAFFDAFLEGQSVGDIFLALRRRFLQDHGNPLGLLYAVHCDGDVRVQPAPV